MGVWTCERVARSIGCSPEQVHRWCVLDKLQSYNDSMDNLFSFFPQRIREQDLLEFFNCETLEEFNQVRYR